MEFLDFKNQVHQKFGLDLNSYKKKQLKRRLDNLLVKKKIANYGQFFKIITDDRKEYHNFLDYLTINVSEFFRDTKMFAVLEDKVMPKLMAKTVNLKMWSAACSIGAEPYSLAIIMNELKPGSAYKIDATDLDQSILQKAQQGEYNLDAVKNISKLRLKKYFLEQSNKYLIKPEIKNKIKYRQHDLLADNYPRGYDLILCRNVTIYFVREAQDKINRQFSESLNSGGYLFIGGSETIFNYAEFGLEKIYPCFYQKK